MRRSWFQVFSSFVAMVLAGCGAIPPAASQSDEAPGALAGQTTGRPADAPSSAPGGIPVLDTNPTPVVGDAGAPGRGFADGASPGGDVPTGSDSAATDPAPQVPGRRPPAPAAPPAPVLPPDPSSTVEPGEALFADPQPTNFGVAVSCASCHGVDGAGGKATAIRGADAATLTAYAQGGAAHPAPAGRQDVKFPELGPDDFQAIAAFLSSGDN
ncbi:MAG: c-type cytochrome [Phycisphaerae bacterium]